MCVVVQLTVITELFIQGLLVGGLPQMAALHEMSGAVENELVCIS